MMEFTILYAIPHTEWLDSFFLALTKMVGSIGQLWLIVGLILLIFKKTRKTGAAVLIACVGVYIFGDLILKHLISRPRPCQLDMAFPLIVDRPSSASFPSTHSGLGFAAATAIFLYHRKIGILVYIVAALTAFSRLYLFLHFPTDVLFGIVLGTVSGVLAVYLCERLFNLKKEGSGESV